MYKKEPRDEKPCTSCKRLLISTEGFHHLPKHLFIERLIQVVERRATCDECMGDYQKETGKEIIVPYKYCVDCRNMCTLCAMCSNKHNHCEFTRDHKLIQINECERRLKVRIYEEYFFVLFINKRSLVYIVLIAQHMHALSASLRNIRITLLFSWHC